MKILTPKQRIIFQAIKSYFARNGKTPSIRELGSEVSKLGLKANSPRSIFLHLRALEEAGYLKRLEGKKGIKIPGTLVEPFLNIPILGLASASAPTIVAEENIEGYLKISKALVNSKNIFAIKIVGDSMNQSFVGGKRIEAGDFVLVDTKAKIENEDIVLVVLDGLAAVKIYKKLSDDLVGFLPKSDNEIHKPIYVSSNDNIVINGKVIDVLKGS